MVECDQVNKSVSCVKIQACETFRGSMSDNITRENVSDICCLVLLFLPAEFEEQCGVVAVL